MSTEKSKPTETAMTADPLLAEVWKGVNLVIKPFYGYFQNSAINEYKVVKGFCWNEEVLFQGTYMDCYNFRANFR